MSITAQHTVRTPAQVGRLGTILGIWAHPDDEAYLSGGLMAWARDAGSRVVCVTATRGERGSPDPGVWPPERLAAERARELARCLRLLGVREHHWLGYEDGRCAEADQEQAVAALCRIVDRVRPDVVLGFGPDGITGHDDHRAASRWAAAAFARTAPPGARLLQAATPLGHGTRWAALTESLDVNVSGNPVLVPEDRLAVHLVLDAATAERKVRALAAQATQTRALIEHLGLPTYTSWVGEEAFVEA